MQTVAEYILDFIASLGVRHVFGLIGGTCGILIDRLGEYQKQGKLAFVPMLHEQAASMAVEGYARQTGFGVCLVSSGPAVTNIMTGVQGTFHESIPCLYIAGQQDVANIYWKADEDFHKEIRQIGTQEGPHVKMMEPITKYSALVKDAADIRYYLEKAAYLARRGRPGPVFLDIPKDLQGFKVDPEQLRPFDPSEVLDEEEGILTGPGLDQEVMKLIELINHSERPVVLMGAGVRLSNTTDQARTFAERLGGPVVCSWGGIDAFPHAHEAFVGSIGDYATRAGNFTVQNCDLLITLGSRLDPRQTTKEFHWCARGAKIVMVDKTRKELEKEGVKIHLPVRADLRQFFASFSRNESAIHQPDISEWYQWVQKQYKAKYPVVTSSDYEQDSPVNPRAFLKRLSELVPAEVPMVADCGVNQILAMTCWQVKEGQRAFENGGSGALGFSVPAAFGMSYAMGKKPVVCVMGDGGFQFNIQELQTIKNHGIPLKIFVLNNKAYALLVNTQDKSYGGRHVASVNEPDGYSAPDFVKVAEAFGIKALRISGLSQTDEAVKEVLGHSGPVVIEVAIPEGSFPFVFVNYGDALEDSRTKAKPAVYLPVSEIRENMRFVPPVAKTLEREPVPVEK